MRDPAKTSARDAVPARRGFSWGARRTRGWTGARPVEGAPAARRRAARCTRSTACHAHGAVFLCPTAPVHSLSTTPMAPARRWSSAAFVICTRSPHEKPSKVYRLTSPARYGLYDRHLATSDMTATPLRAITRDPAWWRPGPRFPGCGGPGTCRRPSCKRSRQGDRSKKDARTVGTVPALHPGPPRPREPMRAKPQIRG